MRKHKFLIMLAVFLVILAAMPFLQLALRGGSLRRLPGFRPEGYTELDLSHVGSDREGIVAEYGYYPDDHWVEGSCVFYIRTGEKGLITLEMFYPFPLEGGETGRASVDGAAAVPFELAGESTTLSLEASPGEVHRVSIECDFARQRDPADRRALAFVLAACAGE